MATGSTGHARLTAVFAAIGVLVTALTACGPGGSETGPGGTAPGKPKTLEPVDEKLLAEGKAAWRGCAKCHCVTDSRIPEDEDWVAMNEETTCIAAGDPAPRLRKALIAHLHNPDSLRPILVEPDWKPASGGKAGSITLPAEAGSAYLRAERESVRAGTPAMVRLVWGASEDEKTVRAPAGTYNVINFWFYRKRAGGDGGERWMVTSTNVNGCTSATIGAEDTEILDVEPILYGALTAVRKEDRYGISFSCQDTGGSRMTLSRNGRVVVPGYRIRDAAGTVVAEGRFAVI